jgi:glycine/D-amino acid oxidase-like deaminating enzyme
MFTDVLIVGQGISGTMLSWYLRQEGVSFIIIDDASQNTSSRAAAGIINPVTGRRFVTTWMIEDLMSFAKTAYTAFGEELGGSFIMNKSIIDFFPGDQMRQAFIQRVEEGNCYLHSYPDQNYFNPYFNYYYGCGEIKPVYLVDLSSIVDLWRNKVEENILTERFAIDELQASNSGIKYKDISAEKIIFCDGLSSANSPFFRLLPFSANKGEALIIECKEIPVSYVYKKSMAIVPTTTKDHYWVGSNYQWEFKDDKPTDGFYRQTTSAMNEWLKLPYKVVEHKAAVRPATLERRPFVGFHPLYPRVGILNGLGTKGTSLAPYFANQLVQHMVNGLPIADEANVQRFSRILSK